MGPQNASKGSRQLYGGGDNYAPSDRANAAVRTAGGAGGQVDGKKVGTGFNSGDATAKSSGSEPKTSNPAGGTPPSRKQQAAARYTQPGGSSVSDEKA